MRTFFLTTLILLSFTIGRSQDFYPSHWFTGFKNPELNLLIRGVGLGKYTSAAIEYPGVKLVKLRKSESANYLYLDLRIDPTAKPGTMKIVLKGGADFDARTLTYQLKSRSSENGKSRVLGVRAEDFLYLIMTDRFANGDPNNDVIPGYLDQKCDRRENNVVAQLAFQAHYRRTINYCGQGSQNPWRLRVFAKCAWTRGLADSSSR